MTAGLSIIKCKAGEKVRIITIKTTDDKILHKLAVFGIFPGGELTILQIRPAYVLEIDHTQLAIDRDLAKNIYVRKLLDEEV
jgi:Fe2+ transport system protein FeoA